MDKDQHRIHLAPSSALALDGVIQQARRALAESLALLERIDHELDRGALIGTLGKSEEGVPATRQSGLDCRIIGRGPTRGAGD